MSGHLFVDETKGHSYVMVAAIMSPDDLQIARKQLAALCRPGQRRVHMNHENSSRRREIISAIDGLGPNVMIYDGRAYGKDERAARHACLDRVVDDAAAAGAHRLIIERDDSVIAQDRRWVYARVHALGCEARLTYEWQRAHEESLLAIPDAVAWCWARGGDWRRRIDGILNAIRYV